MKQEKSDFQSQLEQMSVQQLADLLAYHNRKYWQDNEPEISDDDYDLIVRALAAADPGHPLLNTVQAPAVLPENKPCPAKAWGQSEQLCRQPSPPVYGSH